MLVLALAVVLLLIAVAVPLLRWRTTHYVITTHRLLFREGILTRRGRDLGLSRITDVSYTQTLWERIVNSGTLTIESAGDGGATVLRRIPDSDGVQQLLNHMVEEDADRRAQESAELHPGRVVPATSPAGTTDDGPSAPLLTVYVVRPRRPRDGVTPGPPATVGPVRHGEPVRFCRYPAYVPAMRLLHTSDWHIGRSLHGTDLLAEQEAVLGALAEVVAAESVDVVLVAATSTTVRCPPPTPRRCSAGSSPGCAAPVRVVVLTPGNHDSARRLGTFSELLAAGGLHVRRRDAAARRARAARRRARRRRRLRPAVPRARAGAVRARASPRRAATRPSSAPRWTASGPTSSSGRAPARSSWPTPSSAVGVASDSERDISVGASTSCRPSCSTASTTSRSATCTGRRP